MYKGKFLYLRSENYGNVTIYYENEKDSVKFSMAFCSPKDQFVKEIGRKIAKGRFDANKFIQIDKENYKDLFNFGTVAAIKYFLEKIIFGSDFKLKEKYPACEIFPSFFVKNFYKIVKMPVVFK